MRFLLRVSLVFLLSSLRLAGAETVEDLRSIYEKNSNSIQDSYLAQSLQLMQDYGRALDDLEKRVQKQGDLQSVLAMRAEKKRFETEKTYGTPPEKGATSSIALLQGRFQKAAIEIEMNKNGQIISLVDKYVRKLMSIERELTVAGKIDEAVKMQDERKRIMEDAEVVSARTALSAPAVEEPKGGQAPPAEAPVVKKTDAKSGTAAGILAGKGPDWIEVKLDGDSDITHYGAAMVSMAGGRRDPDRKVLAGIKGLFVSNRVKLSWKKEDNLYVTDVDMVVPAVKSGAVKGKVVDKSSIWIDVEPKDGGPVERYMPHWRGGMPKDGGGLDKDVLQAIGKTQVGSVVTVKWEYEGRKRVTGIE